MSKNKEACLTAVFFTLLFLTNHACAYDDDKQKQMESIAGLNENGNFSLYQPNYFIFGLDDLKLQFSFKYQLAKSIPLYLSFTQTMFWNIYEKSQPFREINYLPETFYRLLDAKDNAFKSLDMGYKHNSRLSKFSSSLRV